MNHAPRQPDIFLRRLTLALLLLVLASLLCGCDSRAAQQERRDRYVAQVAADTDAQAQAIQQGGDVGQGLANIRALAAALAQVVGYTIDPAARPVYDPAAESPR